MHNCGESVARIKRTTNRRRTRVVAVSFSTSIVRPVLCVLRLRPSGISDYRIFRVLFRFFAFPLVVYRFSRFDLSSLGMGFSDYALSRYVVHRKHHVGRWAATRLLAETQVRSTAAAVARTTVQETRYGKVGTW